MSIAGFFRVLARFLRRQRLPKLTITIEFEREADDRWIAEVLELPGVMVYGKNPHEAFERAVALAFRVIADRIEHHELPIEPQISIQVAPRECLALS